jgi:hypothetical protein
MTMTTHITLDSAAIDAMTAAITQRFASVDRLEAPELHQLAEYSDWQVLAERELEARAFSMIKSLPNPELAAIASGLINVQMLIQGLLRSALSTAPTSAV